MRSFTKLAAAGLVLGLLIVTGSAVAQERGGMNRQMGMGGGMMDKGGMMCGCGMARDCMGMMGKMAIDGYMRQAEELGLTDDQVKKLKDRQSAHLKETIDLRAKLQVARIELGEMLDQDTVNMSAVEKKVRANQDLHAGLIIATIKANQDAKNILTPDQRKKAETLKRDFMARGMGMGRLDLFEEGKCPGMQMPREKPEK